MSEQAVSISSEIRPYRFTAKDYHKMAEAGILHEDIRVELIEGVIVAMSPIGDRHLGSVIRIHTMFMQALGGQALVSVQNPIRLSANSEPQPDIVVLKPRADYYATAGPRPADVLLVIEVADSTLGYDRNVKMPLYAGAGIADAWILDLRGDQLRVHREPRVGEYQLVTALGRDDAIAPLAFPALRFQIDELLG